MRSLALASALLLSCAAAPRAAPAGAARPEVVLEQFAAAVEEGRWSEAWPLLSAAWRARTTPARLAADWTASGPVGPEAAARVRALLAAGTALAVGPREASLAVGQGRQARLVREPEGWRVEALE
ncbi:MAG: hypothetical protein HZB56_00205 [Deltaproteobacteria bacterium]|nr:hypothetical protein [Deltaproteobacteria bacterium]